MNKLLNYTIINLKSELLGSLITGHVIKQKRWFMFECKNVVRIFSSEVTCGFRLVAKSYYIFVLTPVTNGTCETLVYFLNKTFNVFIYWVQQDGFSLLKKKKKI